MIDSQSVDLLNLVKKYVNLKKVAATGGGEWHGPCPVCGGDDRLHVQPANRRWACRQCTPHWQDAIAFVRFVEGVDFVTAVDRLGLSNQLDKQPTSRSYNIQPARKIIPFNPNAPQMLNPSYTALNSMVWQHAADSFVWDACDRLWEPQGERAFQYLLDRGLTREVISDAYLGYNPADVNCQWGDADVWLPRGITIPWHYGRQYWRVNIRRPAGEPKYIGPAGAANGLYQASRIKPGSIVVMVEGEFDALVIRSQAADLCKRGFVPVATGTASWARILRWVSAVSMASYVLLAFDADDAGDGAANWWGDQLGSKAYRLRPTAHDITDMWRAGSSIPEWLMNGLDTTLEVAA